MNPVLIKPSGARHSQVVRHGPPVRGRRRALLPGAEGRAARRSSPTRSPTCARASTSSSARAPAARPRSTCATATSPTWAWRAPPACPCWSSPTSTAAACSPRCSARSRCSSPADQAHVAGFVINKFRGDAAILAPGLEQPRASCTGRPDARRAARTSRTCGWTSRTRSRSTRRGRRRPPTGDTLDVAVVRLRWMSNFTDVDALAAEPGVRVRFTRSAADVERADLVVVPGTKATVEDLERLRARRARPRAAPRAPRPGDPILGICGGYQLLGERIDDDVESGRGDGRRASGCCRSPPTFAPDKLLRRPSRPLRLAGRGAARLRDPPRPGRAATAASRCSSARTASRGLPGRRGRSASPGTARSSTTTFRRALLGRVARRARAPLRRPATTPFAAAARARDSTRSATWSPTTSTPTRWRALIERGAARATCPPSTLEVRRVLRFVTTADTEILAAAGRGRAAARRTSPRCAARTRAARRRGALVDDVLDGARVVAVPHPRRPPRLAGGLRPAARALRAARRSRCSRSAARPSPTPR